MLAFLVLSYPTQALIRRSQYAWYESDVKDPCPWVVLRNSSRVSTILRSWMLLTAVWRKVSFTLGGSFSLSSDISSNYLNCSLKWSTNCSVVPLKLSSRTVLVTYWVSLLFSEAPLEEVLMCSLRSLQSD